MAKRPRIAVLQGSTTQENFLKFFQSRKLKFDPIPYTAPTEARRAYDASECDMYCLDRYLLAGERTYLTDPSAHMILPYSISHEAMAPFVCDRDSSWHKTITLIMWCLIEAEMLGFKATSLAPDDSQIDAREFQPINSTSSICELLGLARTSMRSAIHAVGHYGTIFENNLGIYSDIKAPRRKNRPWTQGGLLWCPNLI